MDFIRHFIDFLFPVHLAKDSLSAVVVEKRSCLRYIFIQTGSDTFFVIVRTLVQLSSAFVANTFDMRRIEKDVVCGSAGSADSPSRQSCQQPIPIHLKVDHMIDLFSHGSQNFVKRFGLRERPRKTVEQEAFVAIILLQPLPDNADHKIVRNQVPLIHERLRFQTELGAELDCKAKRIACRDVRNLELIDDPFRLSSFSRTGRTHKKNIHYVLPP